MFLFSVVIFSVFSFSILNAASIHDSNGAEITPQAFEQSQTQPPSIPKVSSIDQLAEQLSSDAVLVPSDQTLVESPETQMARVLKNGEERVKRLKSIKGGKKAVILFKK